MFDSLLLLFFFSRGKEGNQMPSIKSAGAGTETTMFAICETARCQVGRHQESLSSSTSTNVKSPKPSALISCCAVSVKLRQGGGSYDILSLLYIAILIYRGGKYVQKYSNRHFFQPRSTAAIIINVGAHIFLSSGSICSFSFVVRNGIIKMGNHPRGTRADDP